MGRKRTSKKRDLKLSVDGDLIDILIELDVNKSALFTEAARKKIEELSKEKEKKRKKGQK